MLALLAQVDVPSLGSEGPDELRRLLTIFFVLMGVGFVIALLGHIVKAKVMVAVGLGLIFVATGFFMVAVAQQG